MMGNTPFRQVNAWSMPNGTPQTQWDGRQLRDHLYRRHKGSRNACLCRLNPISVTGMAVIHDNAPSSQLCSTAAWRFWGRLPLTSLVWLVIFHRVVLCTSAVIYFWAVLTCSPSSFTGFWMLLISGADTFLNVSCWELHTLEGSITRLYSFAGNDSTSLSTSLNACLPISAVERVESSLR